MDSDTWNSFVSS